MIRPQPASVLFISMGVFVFLAAVSIHTQQPTIKHETARRAQSIQGHDTFTTYCAVCHGQEGKGDGPAAKALKTPINDLRTYAQRHGGTFSRVDMQAVIEGKRIVVAHGTEEMPIWGDVFHALYESRDMRTLLITNLVVYIESLQVK